MRTQSLIAYCGNRKDRRSSSSPSVPPLVEVARRPTIHLLSHAQNQHRHELLRLSRIGRRSLLACPPGARGEPPRVCASSTAPHYAPWEDPPCPIQHCSTPLGRGLSARAIGSKITPRVPGATAQRAAYARDTVRVGRDETYRRFPVCLPGGVLLVPVEHRAARLRHDAGAGFGRAWRSDFLSLRPARLGTYVTAGSANVPGFYPVDTAIALQFRNGHLTGWKRDWRLRRPWPF